MVGEIRDTRDRADRGAGLADRPPRALDAAYEHRGRRGHAPARHGRRALPARPRALLGVVAQRLVRVLNPDTRIGYPVGDYEARLLGLNPARRRPRDALPPGADAGSGYRGRTGIYELVIINDRMRVMIHDRASEQELERQAREVTPASATTGARRCSQAAPRSRNCSASRARSNVRFRVHGTRRARDASSAASSKATVRARSASCCATQALLPVTVSAKSATRRPGSPFHSRSATASGPQTSRS